MGLLSKWEMDRNGIDDPSKLDLKHRLKFLARDSLLYGGAAALNRSFALIVFPLLARYFSVSDFGLIDFFTIIGGLLANFFVFGQDSAVARFFYEYKTDDVRTKLISQSFTLQMGFVLLVLPFFWIAAGIWNNKLSESANAELLLKIVLLQVPFLVLINFSQNLLKWTFSRKRFLTISIGSVIFNLTVLLIAVIFFRIGVEGVFWIYLTTKISFGLLGLLFVRQWLVIPKDFEFLRELIPFAIPFGIICFIGAVVPALERALINTLLGAHNLGLYAAGAKIAMLIYILNQAFQTAWGPFYLAIHKEPDAAHTYNYVLKGFALGVSIVVLCLSAIAQPAIIFLASDRYAGAAIVVFPLVMALGVCGTSWVTEIGIVLSKRSHLNLYSYLAFLLVTVVSVYYLGLKYGLLGVAVGVLAGNIAKAFTASWLAQRVYSLPWSFVPVMALFGMTIFIGIAGVLAGSSINAKASSAIHGLGALFVASVGWFVLFKAKERQYLSAELRGIGIRIWRRSGA